MFFAAQGLKHPIEEFDILDFSCYSLLEAAAAEIRAAESD